MRACVQSAQTLGGNNPTTETGKGPEQNLTKMPHITCQLSWVLTAQTEGAFGVTGTGSSYFSHRMPEKGVLSFLEITPQKRGIVKRSWRDYGPSPIPKTGERGKPGLRFWGFWVQQGYVPLMGRAPPLADLATMLSQKGGRDTWATPEAWPWVRKQQETLASPGRAN